MVDLNSQATTAGVNTGLIKNSERTAHASGVNATHAGKSQVLGGCNDDLHRSQYRTFREICKGEGHDFCEIAENARNTDTFGMAHPKKPRESDPMAKAEIYNCEKVEKLEN